MSYLRAISGNGDEYEPSVSDVEQMLDEVRCFRMASHFFWTLWSIVNVHQEIEFAYWVSCWKGFKIKRKVLYEYNDLRKYI